MIKKVYLLWNAYITNEILVIASLTKKDNNYVFKYESDAIKALDYGCMLPFVYSKDEIFFDSLPHFFTQRMLNEPMLNKLGVDYNPKDELSILTCLNGIKNNDNFLVIREDMLETIIDKNTLKNR